MAAQHEDHWSAEAYQNSAAFVPKLATKVISWLDVQPDDVILDVGCGDGVLTLNLARTLARGKGRIHGVDSSTAMIRASVEAAAADASISAICTFEVLDATQLSSQPELQASTFSKVFSNAAMHWILRPASHREAFFRSIRAALQPGGLFVFEMGGLGNVAEIRTVLLAVLRQRVGIERAREADPWFFPDKQWMRRMLEETVGGWRVERLETEYRPTQVTGDAPTGGVEGWLRLMGKQFFDVLDEGEREAALQEVLSVLKTVVESPGGGDWLGYVRLRALVRKI